MNTYTVNDFKRDVIALTYKAIELYNNAAAIDDDDKSVDELHNELKAQGLFEVYDALCNIEV